MSRKLFYRLLFVGLALNVIAFLLGVICETSAVDTASIFTEVIKQGDKVFISSNGQLIATSPNYFILSTSKGNSNKVESNYVEGEYEEYTVTYELSQGEEVSIFKGSSVALSIDTPDNTILVFYKGFWTFAGQYTSVLLMVMTVSLVVPQMVKWIASEESDANPANPEDPATEAVPQV